jgi:hypothetical protein
MALGQEHAKLFESYVADLKQAVQLAREASQGVVPAAAHPRVLGVVIEYFFRCLKLNQDIEEQGGTDEVEPLVFVHEMLSGTHQDLWRALAELPYLPPGLDREDEWV